MSDNNDDLSEKERNYFKKIARRNDDEDEDEDEDVNENNMNERERQERQERQERRRGGGERRMGREKSEKEKELYLLEEESRKWKIRTGQPMKDFVEEHKYNEKSKKATLLGDVWTVNKRKIVLFVAGEKKIREYDESTNTISTIPGIELNTRSSFSPVQLLNGDVALFGRVGIAGMGDTGSKIFHKLTRTFEDIGRMVGRRDHADAILLPDDRVFIVGGKGRDNHALNSCEIYDNKILDGPRFRLCNGRMRYRRISCALSSIPFGKILVCGGFAEDEQGVEWGNKTEIYDTTTDSFSDGPDMILERMHHSATTLLNGDVLICGGVGLGGVHTEIYRIGSGKFERGPEMLINRVKHVTVLLQDGRVAICGGDNNFQRYETIEFYDPKTNSFTMGSTFY
jgi:hypothetical protein